MKRWRSTPRSKWIDEGLRALAAGGPDAVRIEPLAQALGVTDGGFYGCFDDRGALLDEWSIPGSAEAPRRSSSESRVKAET